MGWILEKQYYYTSWIEKESGDIKMFLQQKLKDINKRLEVLDSASNIVIWGAGVHTNKLFEKSDLLSYRIKEIVDMDSVKQGKRFFGFIVKSPDKIGWSDVDAVLISVPNKEKQIMESLRNKHGFSRKILTLYEQNESIPFYLLYDEDIPQVRYLGKYDSWQAAYDECEGYEDKNIINTVAESVKKVLDGNAVWERDGCLFYEQKYVYPLCAAILRCAIQNKNQGVRILDIGGSLGSTYFQNRKYLTDVKNLEYVIAEQDHFAKYGHRNLENENLKFIKSMDSWEDGDRFDIIFMSASLQYISQYEEVIYKIVKAQPRYIILDRLLICSEGGRICRETVPKKIYKSSYPVMIFTENQIKSYFEPAYRMIEKDISSVPEEAYFIDGKAVSRYYVFQNMSTEI